MQSSAAIVKQKGGPISIEPVELAEPKEGEVLVQVKACGICHTDEVGRAPCAAAVGRMPADPTAC